MNITWASFANTRKVLNTNIALRNKIVSGITNKWIENGDIRQVDIPFCDTLANHLHPLLMKKPAVKTNIKFASKIEH